MILESILDLCGSTPLVPLKRIAPHPGPEILLKLEGFNPGHSVKDRAVLGMIQQAKEDGVLHDGVSLIESTSGNTGVSLAMAGAIFGHPVLCIVDENLLPEKRSTLVAFGAELVTVAAAEQGKNIDLTEQRIALVEYLLQNISGSINLNQYRNPANPQAHYRTTASEIWEETAGELDCVVISVGTGGTVTGVGQRLKEWAPSVAICGVEPYGSTLFGGKKGPYLQQGPGNYFQPANLRLEYIDIQTKVTDRDAFLMTRRLAQEEGIMVGGDSGGLVAVALELAQIHPAWKRIVVICPDNIEKYLDTVFSDDWMQHFNLLP